MNNIKSYFPIFEKHPELVYLDNAATTQRPGMVIDAMRDFDMYENANIHRGVYTLSSAATGKYEEARKKVAAFLGSKEEESVAFTKGTTESINIIARSFLRPRLGKGDNMVSTIMEHHANYLPWFQLSRETGVELRLVSVDKNGNLNMQEMEDMLDKKTRLLAITHVSNTLGTVNDIGEVIRRAHRMDTPVLIDAAQSAALYELDSGSLAYDFLTFSGHKMFGPFGVGVLYADPGYASSIEPFNLGGGMVEEVSTDAVSYLPYPFNLEAGTSNITGVVGISRALDFLSSLDRPALRDHIIRLTDHCREELGGLDDVDLIGQPEEYSGIISFNIRNIHAHDVASFLNQDHIAVRAGMHCTQPLLHALSIPSTVRVSLSIYNTRDDIDRLAVSIKALLKFWK